MVYVYVLRITVAPWTHEVENGQPNRCILSGDGVLVAASAAPTIYMTWRETDIWHVIHAGPCPATVRRKDVTSPAANPQTPLLKTETYICVGAYTKVL